MTADKNPVEDVVEQALDALVYAPIGLLFDGPARFPKLVRNGRNQVGNARVLGPFAVQQARAEVQKRTAGLDGPVVDLLRGLGVVPGPPPGPTTPAAEVQVPVVPTPAAPEPAADAAEAAAAPAKPAAAKKAKKAAKSTARKATKKATTATKKAGKAPAKAAATRASSAGRGSDAQANRAAAEEAVAARTAAADAATPSADVLPIADYDSLSASQVVSRLGGLSAGQLDAIRAYEAATRGRKTILNRVQQLSQP